MKIRTALASAQAGRIIGVIPYNSESVPLEELGWRRELLEPGAFIVSADLFVNRNHNNDIVIGRINHNVTVESKGDGLYFEITDPGTEAFKRSYEDIASGVTPSISFEFGDEEALEVDGVVHVKKAELRAISLNVPNPAYSEAAVYARAVRLAKRKQFCNIATNRSIIVGDKVNLSAVRAITPHDTPARTSILNYARGVIINDPKQEDKGNIMDKEEIRALIAETLAARATDEEKKNEERKRAATEAQLNEFRKLIVDIAGEDYETADVKTLLAKASELFEELGEAQANREEDEITAKEDEKDRCATVSNYRRNCFKQLGRKIWDKKTVQELKRSFEKDPTIADLRKGYVAPSPKPMLNSLEVL